MANYDITLLRQTSILFAEDEDDIRETQAEVYNRLFKNVFIAKNGKEAVEIFAKHYKEIDVIITDINMPEYDGLQVAEKIREIAFTPVILASAYTDSKYTLKAIDLHIEKYLVKPVGMNEIIQAVESAVKSHQKEQKTKVLTKTLLNKSEQNTKEIDELLKENKKLENEIYKNKLILDNYVSSFTTDSKGNILDVSKYFCEVMQYKEDELIGTSINNLRSKDSQTNITKKMLEAIRAKTSTNYTCSFSTKSQLTLDFNILMMLIYNDEEMVEGYRFYLKSNYLV